MQNQSQLYKQEITPITQNDCFVVFERTKVEFDFPVHYHREYELTCIENASQLTRYVGKDINKPRYWDLVLTGPNLIHGWMHTFPLEAEVYEKTLQFHANLFSDFQLQKNALASLNFLLEQAQYGILFSESTAQVIFPLLAELANSEGLQSFILLQQTLMILADDKDRIPLNGDKTVIPQVYNKQNSKLYEFIQHNYDTNIKLEEIAALFNMSVSSFNRMLKAETGNTFISFLNEYRLGMVARKLLETDDKIDVIAQSCGFHNLSNFNKFFKRVYKTTPKQYKLEYKGTTSVK